MKMDEKSLFMNRSVIVRTTSPSPSPTAASSPNLEGLNYSGRSSGGGNIRKFPLGIPLSAPTTCYTAPVHIDVGGKIYTSSLETLTKYPESRLAKLFNGTIPIVLDSLKQHYFLDRDGRMFRHILNFLRHGRLMVPKDFQEWSLLYEEAKYFTLPGMIQEIEDILDRKPTSMASPSAPLTPSTPPPPSRKRPRQNGSTPVDASPSDAFTHDCITVHISPDLGERITVTAERGLLEEVFPEVSGHVSNGVMNSDLTFLTRFPLNGYCKLNSIQVIQRLLTVGFTVAACSGGGMEMQHFTEYLFVRKLPAL
ncbi:LOW QUALITY PROTEIN: BTB/POZ domain-containing protein kctd15-like [Paramacrobiotus metropolitanus]|uniref:LOW QUALITY PROTEIN: BTB/POZ domain-containing protein kctd15-like n=1 Tax=Paramacrobiotus metropolitanus TaxID=2943436 RepID=UPI0024460BC2|nr:LOW QUALITY PROTEIN: BTB/POZ domain-containing protein kctd15-like [Paramacrobiotus metropolitanus]